MPAVRFLISPHVIALPALVLLGVSLSVIATGDNDSPAEAQGLTQRLTHVSVESATVETGESVTVDITLDGPGILRAYRMDVAYDSGLVSAIGCTSSFGICSIDVVAPDTVRVGGSIPSGISSWRLALGTITFLAGDSGGTTNLSIDRSTFVLDASKIQPMGAEIADGTITIEPDPDTLPSMGGNPERVGRSRIPVLFAGAYLALAVAAALLTFAAYGRTHGR